MRIGVRIDASTQIGTGHVAAKAELTRHFLALKIEEFDALRLEIEGLRREAAGAGSHDAS